MSDNEAMDLMAESLDTEFESDEEVKELKNQIQVIEDKKNELAKAVNTMPSLKDQGYMNDQIKTLILGSRTVLTKLEQDIKVGSQARMYEVYAKLLESVLKQFTELRILNETIHKIEVDYKKDKVDITNIGDQPIPLTADQLLAIVDNARESSQMGAIDAEFTIDENDRKEF